MINYSIIIPHKNIPNLLQRCLDSIPNREDVQIIVVDDNSDPNIVDFDKFPGLNRSNVEVIFTKEGKGAGYARNTGIKYVKGKWLLFSDADDYFSENVNRLFDDYENSVMDVIYIPYKTIDLITGEDLEDGLCVTNLDTQESGSHYVWNNRNQLIASCIINGNSCHVLYDMKDVDHYQIIAGDVLNSDGHQSFISDTSFVADTYPDKYRMAKIYKADINTQSADLLLSIYSPKEFQTKDFKCHIACDLHPRVSPSGKYLCFDSPRTGKRGLYIMPLSAPAM